MVSSEDSDAQAGGMSGVGNPHDPDTLPPAIYYASVGPALKAAADVAARRGHPTLHDDLASMIALVELVTRLCDLHLDNGDGPSVNAQLEAAPLGAATMVLREADLDADTIEVMIDALAAAHTRVRDEGVIDDPRPTVAMASSYLADNDRGKADHYLQRSATAIAESIDAWETPAS